MVAYLGIFYTMLPDPRTALTLLKVVKIIDNQIEKKIFGEDRNNKKTSQNQGNSVFQFLLLYMNYF